MKYTVLAIAALVSLASCSTLPKGLTTDCTPECDRVSITSHVTGKTYNACYCDSSNQYRKLVGKLEALTEK